MDTTPCVARRTRSRTLANMLEILKKSKVKDEPVEHLHEESKKTRTGKKRVSGSNSSSPELAKRRRSGSSKDDDVVFVGTISGSVWEECEHVEDDNAGSASVSSLGLKSKLVEPNKVSDLVVHDVDSDPDEVTDIGKGESWEEKTSNLNGSDKGSSSCSKVISLDSDGESSVEKLGSDGEDRESDDDDEDENEGVESETSEYMDESSDLSYQESSEDSEYDCSEDEKLQDLSRRNNSNMFNRLARIIWDKDKSFEEDEKSCDEQKTHQCTEDPSPLDPKSSHKPIEKSEEKTEADEQSCDEQETDQCTIEHPLLNPKFGCEEPKPIEKSEEEKELDELWKEMNFALTSEGIHSASPAQVRLNQSEDVLGTQATPLLLCSQGKHDFVLDEEVGLKCYYCSYVAVEIRDISPAMDKYRAVLFNKKRLSDRKDDSLFNRFEFGVSDVSNSPKCLNNTSGTVWECIPGVKDTLYPHQQEGFEFIWNNLTGTTNLEELKNWRVRERDGCGGCIVLHSPGTGKTRLAIVFLQAYLELFPNSRPVIIAPASMMLTWEEELKKWNVNVPFLNMNSLELSEIESKWACSILGGNTHHKHDRDSIRMVKLSFWCKKKSILGVSYSLFMQLAGENYWLDKEPKKRTGLPCDRKRQEIRKILLEKPELMILDEGHTPRNQGSCIWKVLSQVETKNRILLSGTLFQNNFQELSNVLCLTRPAYEYMISERLKILGKLRMKSAEGKAEQAGIMELKALMSPFVHVHKGSKESLPGLRDTVVVLKPQYLQKKILDRIDTRQDIFKCEHKFAGVSVHPSLLLGYTETMKEKLSIGQWLRGKLERHKLDPNEGVKARFLIEFIRFSESVDEKVLVFSQYLDILELIMEQLSSKFGWTKGKEVFYMHGKLELKERQHLINNFNKSGCDAKVLLASTRACSEGINLTGASRVILLDVVWNPSVERQAISRAYRIGQKRTVHTYHLVVEGTPECNKKCKQAEKHRISELVFSSSNKSDKLNNTQVSEDKILEGMIGHEKLKDMFEKIIYQPNQSDLIENLGSLAF